MDPDCGTTPFRSQRPYKIRVMIEPFAGELVVLATRFRTFLGTDIPEKWEKAYRPACP